MMEPNVPLLRKMVEWVEEQATLTEGREWNQTWFVLHDMGVQWVVGEGEVAFCDTAYCVAGKVAVDAGWVAKDDSGYVHKDGVTRRASDVAAEILGIPDWYAVDEDYDRPEHLFDGGNSAEDIRRLAEGYAGERL